MSREQLTGYRLRDYDHAIAALNASRTSRHLTQVAVAAAMHASPSQVSLWLTGKHQPLAPVLFALAAAHGYDLALIPREDPA